MENKWIPPLILFSLVEYLFKYLINRNEKVNVSLFLEVQNLNIDFRTECEYCTALLDNSGKDKTLVNLSQRLNLLYRDDHEFEIKKRDGSFILHLNINSDEGK